ncbi:hypothetical protein Tco_1139513 [Tanacetum coccineum]
MECLYKEDDDKIFTLDEPFEEMGSEAIEVPALKEEEFTQIVVLGLCVLFSNGDGLSFVLYVVPTSRVVVPTGRYVVPASKLEKAGRDRDGRVIILPPTTADEHIAVQRESKVRTTLLQSIPDDHVVIFHIWMMQGYMECNVQSRISEAEGLHKGYDRMQKILSQLNQLKAKPEDEDINLKFLRALPSSWSQSTQSLRRIAGRNIDFDRRNPLRLNRRRSDVSVRSYAVLIKGFSMIALVGDTVGNGIARTQLGDCHDYTYLPLE